MPENKLFKKVTQHILQDAKAQKKPGDSIKDSPLQVEHPAANIALMIAQPGSIVEKLLAPSTYKGLSTAVQTGSDITGAIFPAPKGFLPRRQNVDAKQIGPCQYTTDKYVLPGSIVDIKKVMQDYKNGYADAEAFLQSDTYKKAARHNVELAERAGFNDFYDNSPYAAQKVATPMKKHPLPGVTFGDEWVGPANDGFYLKLSYPYNGKLGRAYRSIVSPEYDAIEVNAFSDINDTAFHENIHRGSYATIPVDPNPGYTQKNFDPTKSFYDWKAKHLLKENATGPVANKSHEAATYAICMGRKAGLQFGQQYPGKEKAMELFSQMEKDPVYGSSFINYNYEKKPKRVWDALTGQYFRDGGTIITTGEERHPKWIQEITKDLPRAEIIEDYFE